MTYWQFVNWEPVPLENALKSSVALSIAAYEEGDETAIVEFYKQSATPEILINPVVKIGGWAFSLKEFCKIYWVKMRNNEILEIYAPNPSIIYSVFGRHQILKIVEVGA